jgi:hypothetical protein
MKKIFSIVFVVMVGCCLWGVGSSYALMIDTFDVTENVSLKGSGTKNDVKTGTESQIIGTERDLTLTMNTPYPKNPANGASANIGYGEADLNDDTGVSSTLTLTWSGIGGMGLGSIDITTWGCDRLVVSTWNIDLSLSVEMVVSDGTHNLTETRSGLLAYSTEAFLYEDFRDANNHYYADVFHGVQSIQMIVKAVNGADGSWNFLSYARQDDSFGNPPVEGAPEPGTMMLMLMGFGGLLVKKARMVFGKN